MVQRNRIIYTVYLHHLYRNKLFGFFDIKRECSSFLLIHSKQNIKSIKINVTFLIITDGIDIIDKVNKDSKYSNADDKLGARKIISPKANKK